MKIIYVDSLVCFNALVDYLLLLCAGRLCARPLRRWRMALGALWGGGYALLAAVCPRIFDLWTAKLAAGAIAVWIAYGADRKTPRVLAAFYGISAAFGGAAHAAATLRGETVSPGLPLSLPVMLLSFAVCYAAVSLLFRHIGRAPERKIYRVELTLNGRSAAFTALADSGNELTDPISGCAVLVAEPEALSPLFDRPEWLSLPPAEAFRLLCGEQTEEKLPGLRLLPCRCASAEGGLLLCFRPECVRVDGVVRDDLLAAVSRGRLSPDGAYSAIL